MPHSSETPPASSTANTRPAGGEQRPDSIDLSSDIVAAAMLAQAQLAAIVESSDDVIIGKTLDGIITSWNRSAERLFGYRAEEAIGQSILLIVPADRRDEEAAIIARLRRGERIDHFETQRRTKVGRIVDLSVTVSPIRDSTGCIVGASKVARDISDQKSIREERERLLEAERHARHEAQRINQMKDEFLATLSHELRTPLNAILGWAQILASGQLGDDEMKDAGAVIERNARTQKQLIDDLLDMSRIIAGKLRIEMQHVEPASFLDAAIETIRPSASAKGIQIEKQFDPFAGPILGDPARLQQVVWNLLTNAIKFTPAGGRVQVVLKRFGSHIELSVSDTGQGISPEFLQHLFARFSQADAASNRKHGGLGLGLAIARQLVELHGGTIRATSAGEGAGATFIIQLPLLVEKQVIDSGPGASSTSLTPEGKGINLSELTVLVLDDEADTRRFMQRLLSDCGARVMLAGSADEALSVLDRHWPDVLISDIGMPGVDGYEFLRQVRKAHPPGQRPRMPAIALTAFARSEDRTRALRAGYIAHVAKPVESSELLATIAAVAGRVEEHT